MRVSKITFAQLKNLGNFEHQRIEVEVILDDGETPGAALNRARAFVAEALKPRPSDNEIIGARKVLENPDAYTGYQVKVAQEIVALCNAPDELPF